MRTYQILHVDQNITGMLYYTIRHKKRPNGVTQNSDEQWKHYILKWPI